MKTTKQTPSTRTATSGHLHDLVIERQEGETDEAWEALINDLGTANIVTRVSEDSIGLCRRTAGAAA